VPAGKIGPPFLGSAGTVSRCAIIPAVVVTALVSAVVLVGYGRPGAAAEAESGMRTIGTLEAHPQASVGCARVRADTTPEKRNGQDIHHGGCRMLVDEDENLGFTVARSTRLTVYDLTRLSIVKAHTRPSSSVNAEHLVLDTRRKLVLYPNFLEPQNQPLNCSRQPGDPPYQSIHYGADNAGTRSWTSRGVRWASCPGTGAAFGHRSAVYDEGSDRFYFSGYWVPEDAWRDEPGESVGLARFSRDANGQSLVVRQVKATADGSELVPEWDVDLRYAGCGSRKQFPVERNPTPFVARLGNEIIAYCWEPLVATYNLLPQGYLVRIPLAPGPGGIMQPIPEGPSLVRDPSGAIVNYRHRRVPTLPGVASPVFDRTSKRLILLTEGSINGNAAWVFDLDGNRFIGVITGGNANQPLNNSAVGFDPKRGVAYLLTQHGILRASVRETPLPPALLYAPERSVNVQGRRGFATAPVIAVAPSLGRLFLPIHRLTAAEEPWKWFLVVEDTVPPPPVFSPPSPDDLTTQVPEVAGKTQANVAGQGRAAGAHVVVTGGLARTLDSADMACRAELWTDRGTGDDDTVEPSVIEAEAAVFGANQCAAQQIVTPGHREAFLASSETEVGSGSGSSARGTGLAFGSNDSATSGDVGRAGDCAATTPERGHRWGRTAPDPFFQSGWDQWNGQARDPLWEALAPLREGVYGTPDEQGPYGEMCDEAHDGLTDHGAPDVRHGTRGPDDRGFPVPAAQCGDFGGGREAEGSSSGPSNLAASSAAACDLAARKADASSAVSAFALPGPAEPVVAVARASSVVRTALTDEGQVTMSLASASGVTIGPLSIGEVRSLAVTKARGLRGTASADVIRQWCRISHPDLPQEISGCIDPASPENEAFLDELNHRFQQKLRLTVPKASAEGTPGGYQAVATKEAGERGGDQTVNDDDSVTVSGLQVVFYNDGTRGRNRFVVQLAGVHAESRYGIIELPDFSAGDDGVGDGGTDVGGGAPAVDGAPAADLPGVGRMEGALGLPASEVVYEETPMVEDDRGVLPPPLARPRLPAAGSLRERIVRLPLLVMREAINLLVQHPREFGLLLLVWSLLGAPVYLGQRRRAFARAVAAL
jgi:hypothetical protein